MVRGSGHHRNHLRLPGSCTVSLRISKIALYSPAGQIRDIGFRLNGLNIITGVSQTGKSALIDIVDYVTGRNHCHVADGVIRETVSWYAALFDLNGASVFIARRNPASGQRTSGDVYLSRESGSSLPPLTDLVKNTTTTALESFLTAAIGISENQVRLETSPSGLLRAQFRHALFYSFQDQNDIDSKRNLFHRQDEDFVGRDIRDTLPYFLGAMDEDALTKQPSCSRPGDASANWSANYGTHSRLTAPPRHGRKLCWTTPSRSALLTKEP